VHTKKGLFLFRKNRALGILRLALTAALTAPLLVPPAAEAQETATVVEFIPFTVEGMSAEEGMVIEDLVRDHIKKIKNILLVFPGVDGPGSRSNIDYVFQGKIYNEDDTYILQIDVLDSRTHTQNTWTSGYRSSSDMALKAPAINYLSLLGSAIAERPQSTEDAENIIPEKLWGRWQGTEGIEQVFFFPGGHGRAYFSRGASMELAYRIEGKKIIVEQKSKNDPRYYQVPAPVADALAAAAEPKRWELSLYAGSHLRGLLFETAADYEGADIIRLRSGSVRKAEWTKSTR
jgi:hypothetical protein